jgi:hypothetical protein
VVCATPERRALLPELHVAYMAIIEPLLSAHALTLALAIVEIEEAFPALREAMTASIRHPFGEAAPLCQKILTSVGASGQGRSQTLALCSYQSVLSMS